MNTFVVVAKDRLGACWLFLTVPERDEVEGRFATPLEVGVTIPENVALQLCQLSSLRRGEAWQVPLAASDAIYAKFADNQFDQPHTQTEKERRREELERQSDPAAG